MNNFSIETSVLLTFIISLLTIIFTSFINYYIHNRKIKDEFHIEILKETFTNFYQPLYKHFIGKDLYNYTDKDFEYEENYLSEYFIKYDEYLSPNINTLAKQFKKSLTTKSLFKMYRSLNNLCTEINSEYDKTRKALGYPNFKTFKFLKYCYFSDFWSIPLITTILCIFMLLLMKFTRKDNMFIDFLFVTYIFTFICSLSFTFFILGIFLMQLIEYHEYKNKVKNHNKNSKIT